MELKPGTKSTEFYLTLLAQVAGILALFGILNGSEVETLVDAVSQLIGAVTALVVAIAPLVQYIKSRTELKK